MAGATINVASNSGTNKFHATIYEFIRNTDLNAEGFFKPAAGTVAFKKPTFCTLPETVVCPPAALTR